MAARRTAGAIALAALLLPAAGTLAQPSASTLPTIVAANGTPIALASLRGKVVIINFWANWCVPCRTELPSLERLAAANRDRLVVIAASVDARREDGRTAFGNHYPSLRLAYATLPSVELYGALGMPYSVVFDSRGMERRRVPRALNWSGPEGAAVLSKSGFVPRAKEHVGLAALPIRGRDNRP